VPYWLLNKLCLGNTYQMKTIVITFAVFLSGILVMPMQHKNSKVTQFDISPVLNARPITVFADSSLINWTNGIDGGGQADGFFTKSAAFFNKQDTAHALPDDGLFQPTHSHPEIQLHYSNENSIKEQACTIAGLGEAQISVPKAKYKAIFLALTSAEGSSSLTIRLIYTDGAKTRNIVVPDYYQDIPANDQNFCYLAHNLAKWGPDGRMTEKDTTISICLK